MPPIEVDLNRPYRLSVSDSVFSHQVGGTYFNMVDLCGILPYKRMHPHKCGIKINFDILTTQKDQ